MGVGWLHWAPGACLAAALLLGPGQTSAQQSQNRKGCVKENAAYSPDLVNSGCTAVIQSNIASFTGAQAADTIPYGDRLGMEVTVVGRSGIGTEHAVIRVKYTREKAKEFCEDLNDYSQACIDKALPWGMNDWIEGNCKTGWFTSFEGERLQFIGKEKNCGRLDPMRTPYVILQDGEPLGNALGSGYYHYLPQFKALCPGRVKGCD